MTPNLPNLLLQAEHGSSMLVQAFAPYFVPLAVVGDAFYFYNRSELWISRGRAETTRPVRGGFDPYGFGYAAVAVGSRLYFTADDGIHGRELWTSDGTAEGTMMVADLRPGREPSGIYDLMLAGPRLYFWADDGRTGSELWALPVGSPR